MTEEWKWNRKRELAAQLLSECLLNNTEIASKVGISQTALYKWRQCPEFRARVADLTEDFKKRVRSVGIAVAENRIRSYNERWQKMQQVIDARSKDPNLKEVPGGETGLLVHKVKMIGTGDAAKMVDEYEVDTGILKELRDHEKQAAQELGQWTDKTAVSVAYTEQDIEDLSVLTDDELATYISLKQKLAKSKSGGSAGAAAPEAA